MIIMYVSHLFACGWYMVGTTNQLLDDGAEIQSWVNGMGWGDEVGWSTRYIDAYYYAITTLTTVGYGDRTPSTDTEKLFSIMTEWAGGMIFGILAGTLSAMLNRSGRGGGRGRGRAGHDQGIHAVQVCAQGHAALHHDEDGVFLQGQGPV